MNKPPKLTRKLLTPGMVLQKQGDIPYTITLVNSDTFIIPNEASSDCVVSLWIVIDSRDTFQKYEMEDDILTYNIDENWWNSQKFNKDMSKLLNE